ncbi:diketogulonate reductase-like aldo/keto reductase [Inquilinus ginsengisoli]|uniref:Diketogulonate reductase-like aldo/keto reductase n=1 Tax=Inquilinus ginsengisoli TaxID=363840 RepID=A0ABU1JKP8_9PROT|nr:aldo/keto reductase [Inquilinus ginsengisoli]MDR6288897.1 diketogulonate reductase-like aldo/keto reductase [Inquilinus ginsengisoli]
MSNLPTVTANGAEIPALGFGTFRMNGADTARMVRHVLSHGYRHVDTAQIYGNEAEVGEGLAASGVARNDVFLTTKVWVANYRHEAFLRSVDESLKKLRTDHVDLLLLHWPNAQVPLAEQIGALNQVKAAGKVRHIGVSNFSTALMAEAVVLSQAPLVTNQVEYHPYLDQAPVLAAARKAGMSVTAYYGMADGKVIDDPAIQAIGARHGKTAAQVVLRWLVQQGVVALSKTVSEDRAAANLAISDFALSDDEMAAIHALARPDGRLVSPDGLAPVWDAVAA